MCRFICVCVCICVRICKGICISIFVCICVCVRFCVCLGIRYFCVSWLLSLLVFEKPAAEGEACVPILGASLMTPFWHAWKSWHISLSGRSHIQQIRIKASKRWVLNLNLHSLHCEHPSPRESRTEVTKLLEPYLEAGEQRRPELRIRKRAEAQNQGRRLLAVTAE